MHSSNYTYPKRCRCPGRQEPHHPDKHDRRRDPKTPRSEYRDNVTPYARGVENAGQCHAGFYRSSSPTSPLCEHSQRYDDGRETCHPPGPIGTEGTPLLPASRGARPRSTTMQQHTPNDMEARRASLNVVERSVNRDCVPPWLTGRIASTFLHCHQTPGGYPDNLHNALRHSLYDPGYTPSADRSLESSGQDWHHNPPCQPATGAHCGRELRSSPGLPHGVDHIHCFRSNEARHDSPIVDTYAVPNGHSMPSSCHRSTNCTLPIVVSGKAAQPQYDFDHTISTALDCRTPHIPRAPDVHSLPLRQDHSAPHHTPPLAPTNFRHPLAGNTRLPFEVHMAGKCKDGSPISQHEDLIRAGGPGLDIRGRMPSLKIEQEGYGRSKRLASFDPGDGSVSKP